MDVLHDVLADSNVRNNGLVSKVVVSVDGMNMETDLVVLVFVTGVNVVDTFVMSTGTLGLDGVNVGDAHPSVEEASRVSIFKHHRVSGLERVTVLNVHNVLDAFGVHPVFVRNHSEVDGANSVNVHGVSMLKSSFVSENSSGVLTSAGAGNFACVVVSVSVDTEEVRGASVRNESVSNSVDSSDVVSVSNFDNMNPVVVGFGPASHQDVVVMTFGSGMLGALHGHVHFMQGVAVVSGPDADLAVGVNQHASVGKVFVDHMVTVLGEADVLSAEGLLSSTVAIVVLERGKEAHSHVVGFAAFAGSMGHVDGVHVSVVVFFDNGLFDNDVMVVCFDNNDFLVSMSVRKVINGLLGLMVNAGALLVVNLGFPSLFGKHFPIFGETVSLEFSSSGFLGCDLLFFLLSKSGEACLFFSDLCESQFLGSDFSETFLFCFLCFGCSCFIFSDFGKTSFFSGGLS